MTTRLVCALLAVSAACAALAGPPPKTRSGKPAASARVAQPVPGASAALKATESSVTRGLAYLRAQQKPNGSWQEYPGITALVMLAFLRNKVTAKDPAVAKAAAYLVSQVKLDGGIYTEALGPAQALPNYNTALSLMALNSTADPAYRDAIKRGQKFLERSQYDETEGYSPKDAQYGGIGYGSKADNPDVSNLQQALEALKETAYPADGPAFKKAIIFLQRCQNRSESNDQEWAGNDGGFIYAARGESKADEYTKSPHSSYGSMTYAGLKSYLYCGLSKSDPRAQAAYSWLRGNYSVEENPRMRDDGLYYYYHTMSKTLLVYGSTTLVDLKGNVHYWAVDLTGALARRQGTDGSWTNSNRRWQENDPVLSSAYALVSLANCAKSLGR